jgi:hypothetical protein
MRNAITKNSITNELSAPNVADIADKVRELVIVSGDYSRFTEAQKQNLLLNICNLLGLNPLTRPFEFINLNGKVVLYATKNASEQLRKINAVSIYELETKELKGVFLVTAKAQDKTGRQDIGTGAVNVEGLKGDALANALMKAETKAKRRVTLSISGLGFLDESELETIPNASKVTPLKEVSPTFHAESKTQQIENKPQDPRRTKFTFIDPQTGIVDEIGLEKVYEYLDGKIKNFEIDSSLYSEWRSQNFDMCVDATTILKGLDREDMPHSIAQGNDLVSRLRALTNQVTKK